MRYPLVDFELQLLILQVESLYFFLYGVQVNPEFLDFANNLIDPECARFDQLLTEGINDIQMDFLLVLDFLIERVDQGFEGSKVFQIITNFAESDVEVGF